MCVITGKLLWLKLCLNERADISQEENYDFYGFTMAVVWEGNNNGNSNVEIMLSVAKKYYLRCIYVLCIYMLYMSETACG